MVNKHKLGLVFGGFAGLVHIIWSILVGLGWAQGFVDFVFGLHFINPIIGISEFSLVGAIELIVVASIVGYVVGNVVAIIWNKVFGR